MGTQRLPLWLPAPSPAHGVYAPQSWPHQDPGHCKTRVLLGSGEREKKCSGVGGVPLSPLQSWLLSRSSSCCLISWEPPARLSTVTSPTQSAGSIGCGASVNVKLRPAPVWDVGGRARHMSSMGSSLKSQGRITYSSCGGQV